MHKNNKGELMKSILLFLLLSSSNQTLIYNTPTNLFYIVDVKSNPIQILTIEENYETFPSCINNKKYNLKNMNFTHNSSCLMDTLNKDYHLSITNYIDLKNQYSNEELLKLKNGQLSQYYEFITTIDHSFSLSDLYQIYIDANKNEFQFEIHSFTYFKINDIFVPISYPLNGLSKVITE